MQDSANALICSELRPISDKVQVTGEKQQQHSVEGKLGLFEYRQLPNESGGIAFVGGPVSAIDFHPSENGICAISAHSDFQPTHELLSCYQGKGHIQLWTFSANSGSCFAVIPHDGNCAWDLKWKPQQAEPSSHSHIQGTLAAALGDGTVQVYHINIPRNFSSAPTEASPKTVTLRNCGQLLERVPVHVVQWSSDGQLLVVGSADGSIEIYQTSSPDKTWPKWSVPGHESVIMDMRWLSATHLCSLGLSCVLRLRDIRDPVSMLEQNAEGLSGSLSMDTLEPNVAVVGGDYGYLRVVRMSGADGVVPKLPVKRVHLQAGAFRDMKSLAVGSRTVFYTGGPEGILHECMFPRPIWASPDLCNIGKTRIKQKLQWTALTEGVGETLHLQLGDIEQAEVKDESHASWTKGKKVPRKSRAVGKVADGKEYTVFGEGYKQKSVITRIALSGRSSLLAVGIDGGFVTVLRMKPEEMGALEEPKKIIKPLRKRGRPRKVPIVEGQHSSADTVPSMETREEDKESRQKRKATTPIGPKRKRGRPRKTEERKDEKSSKQGQKRGGGNPTEDRGDLRHGEAEAEKIPTQDNGEQATEAQTTTVEKPQGEELRSRRNSEGAENITTKVTLHAEKERSTLEKEQETGEKKEPTVKTGKADGEEKEAPAEIVATDPEQLATTAHGGEAAAAGTQPADQGVHEKLEGAKMVSTRTMQEVAATKARKPCPLRLRIRSPIVKPSKRSARLQTRADLERGLDKDVKQEDRRPSEVVFVKLRIREASGKILLRLPIREVIDEGDEDGRRTRRIRKPSWKVKDR